jgi:hypothetical protein
MPGPIRRAMFPVRSHVRIKDGRRKPKANRTDALRWCPRTRGDFTVHRESPGRQRYHPATPEEVLRFVELIPDWSRLRDDLDGVVLSAPWSAEYADTEGLYGHHAIVLFSWPRDPRLKLWYSFTRHVPETVRYLGLQERKVDRSYHTRWSADQARAYVLNFVLLHEIAHHVDWLLSRGGRRAFRGEPFAEDWAAAYRRRIWPDFVRAFGPVTAEPPNAPTRIPA